MTADLTPGGLFIELDPDDEWPKISENTPDALEFDACRCTVCGDIVAGWLYESDDGYGSGARWTDCYLDGGLRTYCEQCAYDLEGLTLAAWCETFAGGDQTAEYAAALWYAAREPAIEMPPLDPPLVAGVDYDAGCCDLCGRTEMHDHDPDEYGYADFDPDQPRGAL